MFLKGVIASQIKQALTLADLQGETIPWNMRRDPQLGPAVLNRNQATTDYNYRLPSRAELKAYGPAPTQSADGLSPIRIQQMQSSSQPLPPAPAQAPQPPTITTSQPKPPTVTSTNTLAGGIRNTTPRSNPIIGAAKITPPSRFSRFNNIRSMGRGGRLGRV